MLPTPSKEQLAVLNPAERRAYWVADYATRYLKWITVIWNHLYMRFLIWFCIGRRVEFIGLENIRDVVDSKSRVILVANHRSFFDFFSIAYWFLKSLNVPRRMYFPVRSNFFYESAIGIFMTGLMGGWAMFPPIFRDEKKRLFNRYAIDRLIYEFRKSPGLVGFHPEGKRNKDTDPYSFLKARGGIGKVFLEVENSMVIPLFIYGLSNSMKEELKRNWSGNRRKYPIHLMFGKPLDMQHFHNIPRNEDTSLEIAKACMDGIQALAEEHRMKYNPES